MEQGLGRREGKRCKGDRILECTRTGRWRSRWQESWKGRQAAGWHWKISGWKGWRTAQGEW